MKWKLKVLVQFVLAHVPGGERINHRLQLASGRHTAVKIRGRIQGAVAFLTSIDPPLDLARRTVVEVGTGWDGLHPLLLSVLGAGRVVTYDHVCHLREEHLRLVAAELRSHSAMADLERLGPGASERLDEILEAGSLDDLLRTARITYVAPGDAARTELPDASVDVVYSFAVFEHLPEKLISALLTEARRILVPGGSMISVIGTGDHYTSVDSSLTSVNFLKYPEWLWAPLVKNRISYHNRLREQDFLDLFASHGARVCWRKSHVAARDVEAARAMKVDRRFSGRTPEELAVSRSDLVVQFALDRPEDSAPG